MWRTLNALNQQVFLTLVTFISISSFAQTVSFGNPSKDLNFPVGFNPAAIATADLNRDGKLDLVTANANDNTVSVLLGNGNATFRPAMTFAVPNYPTWVGVADINNDGKPDLVVVNQGSSLGGCAGGCISILLGDGTGSFASAMNIPFAGSFPSFAAIADLNHDGNLDIVVPDGSSSDIYIFPGQGDGTFAAPQVISAGGFHGAIAIADMNKDGNLDIVVSDSENDVIVFIGDGAGSFQDIPLSSPDLHCAATSLVVLDINGDGNPDVVTAGCNVNGLIGNGTGGLSYSTINFKGAFAPNPSGPFPNPSFVVAGDLNGDHTPDLVFGDGTGFSAVVSCISMPNTGPATFQCSGPYALRAGDTGGTPPPPTAYLVVGDFNGDGIADLASANFNSNSVTVILGNGDGTLQVNAPETLVGPVVAVITADFNGDLLSDLALVQPNQVSIRFGAGTGAFNPGPTIKPCPTLFIAGANASPPCFLGAAASGDFNQDGKLDLALADTSGNKMYVLLGNGDGTFSSPTTYSLGGSPPQAVLAADVNGDGILDLVIGLYDNKIAVLIGKGDGSFGPAVMSSLPSGGFGISSLAIGDLNGDGKPDLLVGTTLSAVVLFGNSDGTFDRPAFLSRLFAGESAAGSVAIVDLNHDGALDVVVANLNQGVSIFLGNGTGSFGTPITYPAGLFGTGPFFSDSSYMIVADLNGDGNPDIVIANQESNDLSILLGKGDGSFHASQNFTAGVSPFSVAVGDFNQDGRPDIIIGNYPGYITLLNTTIVSNTPAGTGVSVNPIDPTTGGTPVNLTFSQVNQAGNTTLTTSSTGTSPPSGFNLGNPPTYYQLSTTAVFSGSISICINYAGVSFTSPSEIRLFHFEGGAWLDVTTSLDTVNNIICGSVTSFSPFAIFQSAYLASVQPPIDARGTSVFNAQRGVVPVKFTLALNGTPTCQMPSATITVFRTSGSPTQALNQIDFIMPSDDGSNFRIDGCRYIYNLDSEELGPGSYLIQIKISNVAVGNASFGLR